jgi:molybdopterin-containing oxidoreductase family membrane subunit
VIGGKPFTSVVPYTIIGFELMVLLGGLFTVLGLFAMARLPRLKFGKGYSARFSGEEIGLVVECPERDVVEVEALLRDSEAKEVTLVDA